MNSILLLNFHAIGMLIVAAFTIVGVFMMSQVKGRPAAAVHLGLAFLCMSLHNLSFFVGSSVYHPAAAYYRFVAATMSPASLIHMAMFFLYFLSETKRSRPRQALFIGLWVFNIIFSAGFMMGVLERDLIYKFSAMTWDIDDRGFGTERSLVLVTLLLIVVAAAVFRLARSTPGRERRGVALMLFAFLVASLVPVVTHVMVRTGRVGEGVFQNVFTLVTIVGFFLMIVVFINTTKHRTSFVTKIVGVSLVTILVALQYMSNYALGDRVDTYAELRQRDAARLADNPKADIDGLVYVVRHEAPRAVLLAGTVPGSLASSKLSPRRPGTASFVKFRTYHRSPIAHTGDEKVNVGPAERLRSATGIRHLDVYFHRGSDGRLYEAAFAYIELRKYLHPVAARIALALLAVILVCTIGFRLFFWAVLVSPLERLMEGVTAVNNNDLDVYVQAHVDDEIGYLTKYFNNMVSSIREARVELQTYAEELEARVAERTSELRETLDHVEGLKRQQDGDYFLTSQLLKPLSSIRGSNSSVRVESIVLQHKTFRFRKWEEEIGGDICISDQVTLRGEKYTVFLNGDAMGKSMQGAGGSLVLGAVFRATLERSRVDEKMLSFSPERWLRSAFIEQQRVFESFDSQMLVSAVMGLADERTGFLYFMNADHPRSVFLRAGRAQFMEEVPSLNKFGAPQPAQELQVRTFQMLPGDLVIFGSDGRDDIRVNRENAEPFINDDELLFLSAVETSEGDMSRIVSTLREQGQLIDDLSLLSLFYDGAPRVVNRTSQRNLTRVTKEAAHLRLTGDAAGALRVIEEAAAGEMRQSPRLLLEWVRAAYATKDFRTAGHRAQELLSIRPGFEEILHLAAVCGQRLGEFESALDLAHRALARNPTHLRYLLLVSALYGQLGRYDNAWNLLEYARDRYPGEEKVRKLGERLQSMKPRNVAHAVPSHSS